MGALFNPFVGLVERLALMVAEMGVGVIGDDTKYRKQRRKGIGRGAGEEWGGVGTMNNAQLKILNQ